MENVPRLSEIRGCTGKRGGIRTLRALDIQAVLALASIPPRVCVSPVDGKFKGRERHGERPEIATVKGLFRPVCLSSADFARCVWLASRTRAERIHDARRQLALHSPHLHDSIAHSSRTRASRPARTRASVCGLHFKSTPCEAKVDGVLPNFLHRLFSTMESVDATGPPRPRARRGAPV